MTPEQLAAFTAGREEFENVETPETGLGPIFNNVSCAACHSAPATGGASTIFVTRFGRMVEGVFDPMADQGGSLLQEFAIDPAAQEVVPADATVIARRMTTPLFGMGLVEAIPDRAILQNALRRKPDGVKGRASLVIDVVSGQTRVGRFGWKAQQATLLAFSGDAYRNEMGITNRFFPTENAPNGKTDVLALFDTFGDPEDEVDPVTGKSDIDKAADFMRFLAAPPHDARPHRPTPGEQLFRTTGCANCHTPMMLTGPNKIHALDRKQVWLFSDLLLHDMGTLCDGVAQASADTTEMRTAPLWGLQTRTLYLHDGRATTIDDAIRAHDGEAAASRDRYLKLTPADTDRLLKFLGSL